MSELPDLVVKIKADLRQLLADLAAADAAIDEFGTKASRSGDKAKDSFKGASSEAENFDRLVTKAGRDGEQSFATVRRRIDETKASIVDLRKQVLAGGGGSLFGDLKKAESDLKALESIGKDLGVDIAKSMEKSGIKAAASFGDAFSSTLADILPSSGAVGPILIGVLVAAAAAAAPAIIAILGAAVATAFGVAFVAAGIIAASKSPAVQQAFKNLTSGLGAVFKDVSGQFVVPVRGAIAEILADFKEMAPQLRVIFGEASHLVQPLVDALMGLVESMLPGFRSALANLGPVFAELSRDLPKIGTAIGGFFDKITENGPQVAFALSALISLIVNLINWTGSLIQGGENLFYMLAGWGAALNQAAASTLNFIDKIGAFGGLLKGVAGWFQGNADSINKQRDASNQAVGPASMLAQTIVQQANAVNQLTTSLQYNIDAINKWTDTQLAADDANLALHQAITNFDEALKNNRHNWDLNTKSGQALYGAYQQVFRGIMQVYEGQEKLHPDSQKLVQEQLAAEQALYKQAKAAGATKDELDTLRTSIDKLKAKLAELKSKTIHVKIAYSSTGTGNLAHYAIAQGGVKYKAQGGIDYAGSGAWGQMAAFADSGVYSGGGQASLVKFAEPSTGGEAYISRNGDRGRQWGALMTALGWMAERSPGSTSSMTINNSYGSSDASGDIVVNVNSILDGQKIARSQVRVNQRQLMRTGTSGQA